MNLMGNLQQFGRSLMLPTITLPVAAILLRIGDLPWDQIGLPRMGEILILAGQAIFTYLPFIFAIGVALGLTESASIAAMAALVGYYIFTSLTRSFLGSGFELGVSGGIMIGLVAALSYNRFKNIRLPEYIQFFGGPRFVPLFTALVTLALSMLFIMIGPTLQKGLEYFGQFLLGTGGFGTFIYGVLYRLLVPSGLHHILNNFFWFQLGSYERGGDEGIVFGDLPRFFAGDPTAGVYMAGLYPIMMFALPAIALAIVQEAREDLKPKIRITFFSAALASILTGVSEPIEFAFLFAAPYLFVIHAFLSGAAMWIAYELDIHHGFAYSAGAIDYLINYHLSNNALLLLPIGLAYGAVYYVLFRWAIRRFQIPTPGREEGSQLEEFADDIPYRAPLIVQALGGKQNIVKIEACITRLRLTLANDRMMDINALKGLGAAGTIRLGGGNVQVVFGTFSELIREEMINVLRKDVVQVLFQSPMQGRMIPLAEVPDPIFAGKIVGGGVAFLPERGELLSPVAGTIVHLHPAMHAIGLQTEEGLEVLLHIGINTSDLPGKWFHAAVQVGDVVEPGQLLIRFNHAKIKQHAKSLATPMVITNSERVRSWSFAPFNHVKKGQKSVMSVVLKELTKDNNLGGGTTGA
ncbi:glucose PTS transporter subunit IIA [Paenibacillus sp. y28]|uniref:glucose PTS transporter subunit IIA n=1 Tax=Paenibacillus sp. y28 TaxID=3129110 RepID=UPI0030197930